VSTALCRVLSDVDSAWYFIILKCETIEEVDVKNPFINAKIIMIFVFMLMLTATLSHSQIFYPDQDAYVYQYFPDNNYGDEGRLWIYSDLWYDGTIARSLIQFDLTAITPGTPIQAAMLHMYMFNQAGTDMIVELHSILQPWNEMNVTWNNQPIHDTDCVAFLPYQGYGWWHFPVTGVVQFWVNNPGLNHGLKIKQQIEQYPDSLGRAVYFYSHDTTLERPNLEVIPQNIEEQRGFAAAEAYRVYPNPAHEYFTVCLPPGLGRYMIRLYDITGKKIKEVECKGGVMEKTISLTDLTPGIYFVEINGNLEQKMIKVR